MHNHKHGEV